MRGAHRFHVSKVASKRTVISISPFVTTPCSIAASLTAAKRKRWGVAPRATMAAAKPSSTSGETRGFRAPVSPLSKAVTISP